MRIRRQKSGAAAEVWMRVKLSWRGVSGPRAQSICGLVGCRWADGRGAAASPRNRYGKGKGNADVGSQGRGRVRMLSRAAGERYMWL